MPVVEDREENVMEDNTVALVGEDRSRFARIVARTWADEETRQRYQREPRAMLSEAGIDYPAQAPVPVLPPPPDEELNIEALELVAGSADIAPEVPGQMCYSSQPCWYCMTYFCY
jgi:hypothetical protein